MEAEQLARIRHYLGRSQRDFARLLGISPRTIQSFEQGLRHIPAHIERQALIYLSLKKISSEDPGIPCWEQNDCKPEWRKNCFAYELRARNFCWAINGTYCHGQYQYTWDQKMDMCRHCPVFNQMMPDIT